MADNRKKGSTRRRGGGQRKAQTEVGRVILPQASQKRPEATKGKEGILFQNLPVRHGTVSTFVTHFWPPELVEKTHFHFFKLPKLGSF